MRTITIASAAFAPLSVAAVTIATAATAVAASPTVGGFGTREQLFDDGGAVITGWTLTDFRPSSDTISYQAAVRARGLTPALETGASCGALLAMLIGYTRVTKRLLDRPDGPIITKTPTVIRGARDSLSSVPTT